MSRNPETARLTLLDLTNRLTLIGVRAILRCDNIGYFIIIPRARGSHSTVMIITVTHDGMCAVDQRGEPIAIVAPDVAASYVYDRRPRT